MTVLIIEDERPAAERLVYLLQQYDRTITVSGVMESIEDAVYWFKTKALPDVVLMDIQLADGYSFDIFNQVTLNRPVIFTTAYDNYAIDAFKYFSIDYILKPVTAEALANALNKLATISAGLTGNGQIYRNVGDDFMQHLTTKKYKERFVAKIGQRIYFVQSASVAWFEADNKIVYLIDKEGTKYVVDFTMERLEQVLNPEDFVRISRKYIIHHDAVEHMKPYVGNRMQVNLSAGKRADTAIVSRERVMQLKEWA
jgi:two-component system, LytTR family, response regulator LytT